MTIDPGDGSKPESDLATLQAAHFEKLVAELSNTLVMTPARLADDRIQEWLQRAAEFLGFEGAAVCQFSPDRLSARITNTWMAPGLPSLPETLGNGEWPWVFERLREGKAVAFCSPDELPPEADIDIRTYRQFGIVSCLSVPLACDGVSMGAVAMGTLTRPYAWSDPIVQRIRLVGELLGGALVRKRVLEEIEQQLRFEEMISECSAALMAATITALPTAMETGLQRIATFFGVDRCSVFEFSNAGAYLRLAHVWAAAGVPVISEIDLNRQFPWVATLLRRGEVVAISGLNAVPADAKEDRRSWESAGLQSALLIPSLISGAPRYLLTLACARSSHEWPDRLMPRMKLVGSIFAHTLERMHADRAIQQHVTRLAEAQRIAHVGDWDWDLLSNQLDWSAEVYRIFGVDPTHFNPSIDAFWALVHPQDLAAVQQEAQRAIQGVSGVYSIDHRIVRTDGSCRTVRELATPRPDRQGRTARLAGTVQDITEVHEAYQEIRRLKEQLEAENSYLREELTSVSGYGSIVGASDAIRRVLLQAQQVAATNSTVMIFGETGTGKELLAHCVHKLSPRMGRPFITTNLAAMPSTLIESELFGREKGAFTGALTKQIGRFEAADGGTIFLDEIGEMPPETQAKLLRVIEGGEFERLGSSKTIRVNVRLIAATNRDLAAAVRDGTFRQDLYYRLNVFPITLPPLRERREDIPALAWTFVKEFGERMGKPIDRIKRSSLAALQAYHWPGNVRELRNVIERSMILTQGPELNLSLPEPIDSSRGAETQMRAIERRHIQRILETTNGRIRGKGGAAELLGLKPSTLYARMKKLDICRAEGRPHQR